MSFDLGVWYSESMLSDDEAAELYLKLCTEKWKPPVMIPAVESFYRHLIGRYPEIDSVPEHEIDLCPWNCRIDRSDRHVLVCIAWSRAEEVAPVVVSMALQKGLICFDPQASKVHMPQNLKPARPRFRFW